MVNHHPITITQLKIQMEIILLQIQIKSNLFINAKFAQKVMLTQNLLISNESVCSKSILNVIIYRI